MLPSTLALPLRKIAMQLHEKLDRMENEDEQEQRLLPERVDSERAALKSTMSYSRAVAVVSMEREVRGCNEGLMVISHATPRVDIRHIDESGVAFFDFRLSKNAA